MESQIRKNTINYIKEHLETVSDSDIINVYNKIISVMNNNNGTSSHRARSSGININETNRITQIICIETNLRFMNKDNLEHIKKMIVNSINYKESTEEKMNRVMLEILNKILIAMGKDEIQNMCDFKNIHRDELIQDKYKNIIDVNLAYILNNGYRKSKCMVYQQKTIKHYHLSIIKGMLKSIGYKLLSTKRSKISNEERNIYTTYHIEKMKENESFND
jgi:hypothetical protein